VTEFSKSNNLLFGYCRLSILFVVVVVFFLKFFFQFSNKKKTCIFSFLQSPWFFNGICELNFFLNVFQLLLLSLIFSICFYLTKLMLFFIVCSKSRTWRKICKEFYTLVAMCENTKTKHMESTSNHYPTKSWFFLKDSTWLRFSHWL
jgi:hypothetical protein